MMKIKAYTFYTAGIHPFRLTTTREKKILKFYIFFKIKILPVRQLDRKIVSNFLFRNWLGKVMNSVLFEFLLKTLEILVKYWIKEINELLVLCVRWWLNFPLFLLLRIDRFNLRLSSRRPLNMHASKSQNEIWPIFDCIFLSFIQILSLFCQIVHFFSSNFSKLCSETSIFDIRQSTVSAKFKNCWCWFIYGFYSCASRMKAQFFLQIWSILNDSTYFLFHPITQLSTSFEFSYQRKKNHANEMKFHCYVLNLINCCLHLVFDLN